MSIAWNAFTPWSAMSDSGTWLAAGATIAVLVFYELALDLGQRLNPSNLARPTHARLHEEWFAALSQHPDSEVLAVQTIRSFSARLLLELVLMALLFASLVAATTCGAPVCCIAGACAT